MSAVYPDVDETMVRALFERRARALVAVPGVPSLDAVLRAARVEPREASSGKGRAWRGLALAAACLLAVMKARAGDVPRADIVADSRSHHSASVDPGTDVCEEPEGDECSYDTASASSAPPRPIAQDDEICSSPPASFASSTMLSCSSDDALRTEIR